MKIAIIGAGNMGGAIARGLARGGKISVSDIYVSNPSRGKLDALKSEFPEMNLTSANCEAVSRADLIIVAVKPWKVQQVLHEINPCIDYDKQAVASVAGGLGFAQLSKWLDKGDGLLPPTYIIIPNTAIAVMSSMTFIASQGTKPQMDAEVAEIFSEMGEVMFVDDGTILAGTALASCGIAYAMRYIRAAMEGGVELGLRPAEAQRVVMQTLRGAVDLLAEGGSHPEAEIDRVTTPGGLTIKGLNAMEAAGFTNSVIEGLRASVKKV